jgi:hypothetical protein
VVPAGSSEPAPARADVRSYDTVIAAIVVSKGLAIHTGNSIDFAGIDGLEVVAVPHPHPDHG